MNKLIRPTLEETSAGTGDNMGMDLSIINSSIIPRKLKAATMKVACHAPCKGSFDFQIDDRIKFKNHYLSHFGCPLKST